LCKSLQVLVYALLFTGRCIAAARISIQVLNWILRHSWMDVMPAASHDGALELCSCHAACLCPRSILRGYNCQRIKSPPSQGTQTDFTRRIEPCSQLLLQHAHLKGGHRPVPALGVRGGTRCCNSCWGCTPAREPRGGGQASDGCCQPHCP
jgi:hypothetical protein